MQKDDFDKRPTPEELLELAKQEENQHKRGDLVIYLGYAPGVGKTYAMLSDAHLLKKEGVDVIVGYAETHGRPETEALLEGLELIEPIIVEYKGLKLKEVNFQKIIERNPELVIIDELFHTNPPGFIHPKRYQDIEDILNRNISVYTAMNIQHIESLNDLIYQITGIVIQETVPDSFIQQAKEIKLVDLTPEELLKRLKEGKVYVKNMAESAVKKYFRLGNLLALRQIALRVAADSVDEKMKNYMKHHAIAGPWAVKEKILVGVFASPYADQLIRAAYRLASEIDASWVAVHVETQKNAEFTENEKKWLNKAIELAQHLGGEIVWLKGDDIASEIIDYAKEHNITKIIIGKPLKFGFLRQTIPEKIITRTENIDIYLLSPKEKKTEIFLQKKRFKLKGFNQHIIGITNIILATTIGWLAKNYLNHSNLLAFILLVFTINAFFLNVSATVISAIIGILLFDFFFIPPQYSFAISDLNFFGTFLIYAAITTLISILASKLRKKIKQLKETRLKEMSFYEISKELVMANSLKQIFSITVNYIKKIFSCEVAIFTMVGDKLEIVAKTELFNINKDLEGIASWCFFNKKEAGLGTNTIPNAPVFFIPMLTSKDIYGVIGISFHQDKNLLTIEDKITLSTISHLTALAVERIELFYSI